MKTKIVGQRDFRKDISHIAKKAKNENIVYIVTNRNTPVLEVKPCINNTIECDSVQADHYTNIENSLEFWNDDADENLFIS